MGEVSKIIGKRIRNYRNQMGLSQEKLAELCGCHPTYIGQIERGEKNATIESVARIASALEVSLSKLFEKIDVNISNNSIPLTCYDLISSKSLRDQEQLLKILLEVDKYKTN